MLRHLASVSGWTLISRISGFGRDIFLAAVLGAGALMDAFTVANRLPNHFRAIFGEGAFNAAFIPAYSQTLERDGLADARKFSAQIGLLLTLTVACLTVLALIYTPTLITWLAPGFVQKSATFALAVDLTRITFPYLLLITAVTLLSSILNTHKRFVAAAAAPVLLNVSIIAALATVFLFPDAPWIKTIFPNNAYAAAWGVCLAGFLELALVWIATARAGCLPVLQFKLEFSKLSGFFKAFLPAVIGSAGTQLAMFADTILVTYLAEGSASALYYADRLYQLPIGVIGIAAGTVVLPTMSRFLAGGQVEAAFDAQNRAMGLSIACAMPFVVMFILLPHLLIDVVFARGAFQESSITPAASVLMAYALGLPAMVMIRSIVASFYARSDTKTPLMIALFAIGCNIALKLWLTPQWGVMGLALSTALGAWLNALLLYGIAWKKGWTAPDTALKKLFVITAAASVMMASVVLILGIYLGWKPASDVSIVVLWLGSLLPIASSFSLSPFWLLSVLGSMGMLMYILAFWLGVRAFQVRLR